ncbi:hypothetical protein BpHYR1_004911 [Brachionus plicatilis]|uniref:Uncharacterized protein n=1 Tax=Brachionus plicatilis TaxID=10195 RepID=A0A3M7SJV5_BRAPC|nr:hypothetical protein BpHYR1_004911 [Brachionus plicatilis]
MVEFGLDLDKMASFGSNGLKALIYLFRYPGHDKCLTCRHLEIDVLRILDRLKKIKKDKRNGCDCVPINLIYSVFKDKHWLIRERQILLKKTS